MDLDEIKSHLEHDLKSIGLPVEEVDIKFSNRYSKTYFALYYPKYNSREPHIRIYPYSSPDASSIYHYNNLLDTAIHEMCHHLQFRDPLYVRVKGVVHNEEFWELYGKYRNRAETVGLLKY